MPHATAGTLSWSRSYSYDDAGNITNIGDQQFVYDALGRLKEMATSGTTMEQYGYDRNSAFILWQARSSVMAQGDINVAMLEARLEELKATRLRLGNGDALDAIDVDLYQEEAYIAGLCSRYLANGSIAPYTQIMMSIRLNARIDDISLSQEFSSEDVTALKRYYQDLIELANLVARLSGASFCWS